MKKVLLGIVALFALVVVAACGEDPIDVESVTLDEGDLELEVGESVTVSATVEPDDADNLEVRWSTSDSQVAVVSEGEIQALRPGSATITATSRADEDISASLTVTVIAAPMSVEDVLNADEGDEVNTIGVVTAITNHATFFIADDSGAISVYDGDALVIEDINVGDEVRLWGERDEFNGLLQIGSLERYDVLSTGNDLPDPKDLDGVDIENNAEMLPYQSHRVNLVGFLVDEISTDDHDNIHVDLIDVFDEDTPGIRIRYDSRLGHDDDAEALLELEEGDLIDVTGMTLGWFHGPQLLYTSADEFAMSDVTLDLDLDINEEDEVEVPIHGEHTIDFTVQPAAYADQDVTFASSDESVATVDENGVITGIKSGETTITVTVVEDDSIYGEFTVVVPALNMFISLPTEVSPEDPEEAGLVLELINGVTGSAVEIVIDYVAADEGEGFDQDVTFEIDDDSIVTFSDGMFHPDDTEEGWTKVTVTSDYDDATVGEFYIVVRNPETDLFFPPQQSILVGTTYAALDEVRAIDELDGDITGDITITDDGDFDPDEVGEYTITFEVENSYGKVASGERTINVVATEEELITFPTGEFNYRYLPAETRNILFAHAERYLMETMYGGVPVYMNAGYAMYHPRLEFPVDEYIPVMGFGLGYATMSEDDSNVDMEDGSPGNAGEYTYRTAMTSNPDTFDQWNYTDSVTADIATLYLDSLYYFAFNEDLNGYDVLPSMATEMPRPFDAEGNALVDEDFEPTEEGQEVIEEFGRILARTWTVSLQEDLEWYFHPETDSDDLSTDITAHDFINTYKLALEENWFRAIAGGGDFTSAPQEIVGAQEFADGEIDFEDVGLTALDDYTLEFQFVDDMDEWSVIYWLSSFVMTPIHLGLYDQLDEAGDTYGVSETTIAYHGPYYVDYYEPDQIVRLAENPNFHEPDRHFYTHYTWRVIEDVEIRFQEFLAGRLDAVAVPGAQFEDYQDDPRIRFIPGATTFRMVINSLPDMDAQLDRFPGSSFEPEPILSWELEDGMTMRNAIFYALNRDVISNEVMVTNDAQMFYFSSAYMVAPETGVDFRTWDYQYGMQWQMEQDIADGIAADEEEWMANEFDEDYPYTWVGRGFSPSTYGFNPDLARDIFEEIVEEMVAEGIYEDGDRIVLDFGIQSGSEALVAYAEYVRSEFERHFYHRDLDIGITIDISTWQFPDNYFQRSLIGVGDLNMGGISGSTLDAASFLYIFAEDNRGGFTMDWGIDTSTANIEVTYENLDGETVTEMWSFDALASALNGTTYVLAGQESTRDIVIGDDE